MTVTRLTTATAMLLATVSLSACGGEVRETCNEPQAYQEASRGKKIEVPEDLDNLSEFKEMPLPEAKTPPRAAGERCIDSPPLGLGDA